MKKLIIALGIALSSWGAFAQEATTPAAQAEIKFDFTEHDFRTIKEGTLAEYEFTFTNTGKAPLILANVQPSCGCTTPQWSKEPINPGAKGSIKAVYNSHGRPGTFQKYITVKSNAVTGEVVLTIKGAVTPTPVEPVSPVKRQNVE